MNLSRHFILLNGEAKTLQIGSIERFGSNAFRVRFKNNHNPYTYGADKVVWLSNPEWIDVANNKVNFIDDKTAAACYLNPNGHKPSRLKHADLIYPNHQSRNRTSVPLSQIGH